MSYHILFEGVCFVLSYPTHIWNAYGVENLHLVKEDMEVSRFGIKARSRCKYALNFLKVRNSCVGL